MTSVSHALESLGAPKRSKLVAMVINPHPWEVVNVATIVQPPQFSCLAAQALHSHPLPPLFGLSFPQPEEALEYQTTLRSKLDFENSHLANRGRTG